MHLRRPCPLLEVVDTDTLRVEWEGQPRLVRLLDVNPERAGPGGAKPPTAFGRQTLEWARDVLLQNVQEVVLEFPGDEIALSNSGKLLCYVLADGENYNVRLVREGWSPCFCKYGRPRIHAAEMAQAELRAKYEGRGIWGGQGGRSDYSTLLAYWSLRSSQVDRYRLATAMGEDILNSRLDYGDLVARAEAGASACLFAELTRSYHLADGSVLIQLGNPRQPLAAHVPPTAAALAGFLEREFIGFGKPNYVHFYGNMTKAGEQPQITIEMLEQIAICPPNHLE